MQDNAEAHKYTSERKDAMRVLMISAFGTKYIGGGNISALLLAESLNNEGIRAEIEYIRSFEVDDILDKLLLKIPQGLYDIWNPFLDILIRKKVYRLIKKHNPDIVDFQDRYLVTPMAGKQLDGVAKVFTVIDVLSKEQLTSSHSGIKFLLLDMKRRVILRKLINEENIITNSRTAKEELVRQGYSPNHIRPIYRSLPPSGWYEIQTKEEPAVKQKQEKVQFLLPGRIAREKGTSLLLEAVELLNAEGRSEKFEVIMIGRGPLKTKFCEELKTKKIRNITVRDPIPIEEMREYYLSSDVILLPYINNESFGRVALESLLLEKPMITTLKGGLKETLSLVEGGYIKIHNSDELAAAMGKFINDPALSLKMSDNIRQQKDKIISNFNHSCLLNEYLEYYRSIL